MIQVTKKNGMNRTVRMVIIVSRASPLSYGWSEPNCQRGGREDLQSQHSDVAEHPEQDESSRPELSWKVDLECFTQERVKQLRKWHFRWAFPRVVRNHTVMMKYITKIDTSLSLMRDAVLSLTSRPENWRAARPNSWVEWVFSVTSFRERQKRRTATRKDMMRRRIMPMNVNAVALSIKCRSGWSLICKISFALTQEYRMAGDFRLWNWMDWRTLGVRWWEVPLGKRKRPDQPLVS
jgi:hypothetical protein